MKRPIKRLAYPFCIPGNPKRFPRIFEIAAVSIATAILFLNASNPTLPAWIPWQEQTINLSKEKNLNQLILSHQQVIAYCNGEALWQTNDNFRIQQMLWCDIDRDSKNELVLLSWKIGRFGKARPFWEHEEQTEWSQHIYIYDWDAKACRMDPIWMASDIGVDAMELSYDASNQYLFIQEKDGSSSVWGWLSWGLGKIDTSFSLIAAGDNLIHLPIYRLGLEKGNFDFLYQHIRSTIENADIAVLNQETPLVSDSSLYGDYPYFGTPVQIAAAVRNAGFDIATCATNHAMDRSMTGIDTTVSTFQNLGMSVLGIQSSNQPNPEAYQIISCKGARLALFNYTDSLNGHPLPKNYPNAVHRLSDMEQMSKDFQAAKANSDFVIVFVHWGTEYATSIDEKQKKWTQFFLDQNVDVVIGTHPHVTQSCELLTSGNGHQMLVFYSLGNFMSAQNQIPCVRGELAQITFALGSDGYQIEHYETLPIITHQESGYYSVFSADDYPDILAKRHRLGEIVKED